jgi:ATP-binding cassette subfamily B protein
MQGIVTLGQLVAFLMYINLFFRPLHLIADRFNTLQMGIVSTDRIMRLLENDERVNNIGTYTPKHFQGAITFQNVWFAYEDKDYVLKDISFQVEAQKSLAIVGATGAGKSTIIHLLERLYEVQKGIIQIDGIIIKESALLALRGHVGIVLQDVFLFSGSIYENITLGSPDIARERVVEATQLIGMHDFILQLPGGYDYNVMERGLALSMGQRQLLAFARVLVYDPCLLILDEATASLDTESERLIKKATAMLMQNRTCLIIAHRLATIQHADNILVLKDGEIQEEGTHKALLAQGGYYTALYQAT